MHEIIEASGSDYYVILRLDGDDTAALAGQDSAVAQDVESRVVPRAKAIADELGTGVMVRDATRRQWWFAAPDVGMKRWVVG